jgi:hypothetical protein
VAVVVVSGLPRSGTSMMMQMLAAGGLPLVAGGGRAADEDNPRGYFEDERVKQLRKESAWLADAEGKAVKVIHALLAELPRDRSYKVILMKRPIAHVLRSQRAMIERRGTRGSTLDDAALGAVFGTQLERVERWLADQACMSVLSVDYDDAVQRPSETAARVAAFLDRPLSVDAMARAVDPSLRRQRG